MASGLDDTGARVIRHGHVPCPSDRVENDYLQADLTAPEAPAALINAAFAYCPNQAEVKSYAYDISKGGLVMLTRTLALDLAKHGIRVNAITPGLIRTPLTAPWLDAETELRRHYERCIPLGRIGSSDDCAGAAVYLASDAAAYVTGRILVVDGGLAIRQIGPLADTDG